MDWDTGSRSGPDCEKLESFESFVRQIGGHSPMSSFAHMLYTLRKSAMNLSTEQGAVICLPSKHKKWGQ